MGAEKSSSPSYQDAFDLRHELTSYCSSIKSKEPWRQKVDHQRDIFLECETGCMYVLGPLGEVAYLRFPNRIVVAWVFAQSVEVEMRAVESYLVQPTRQDVAATLGRFQHDVWGNQT